ncbi:hypothetical protein N9C84_03090 [Desulfobacterales bacterium]|nr:hypothetical protein [Desulfobacterales bacterium]
MKLKISHKFAILLSLFLFFLLIPLTALAQTPTVTTQAVTSITTDTATSNGDITDLGAPNPTAHGVCWNTGGTPTTGDSSTDAGAASATGAFTGNITGLSANITYFVRAYATNTAGTSYGNQVSFTTSAQAPTVTTQAVSGITATNATGNGNITDLGAPNPTAHGVCWSTGQNPTTADDSRNEGAASATGAFTSNITGLSANITYYVRAYATNAAGTSYGSQVSFTTNQQPPTVTTQAVSGITITTATGNGNITDLGVPNPTAHGVCWSTDQDPTIADNSSNKGAASATGAFTANINGLSANTTYYVRAYATNAGGTSYGNQVSFRTEQQAPEVSTLSVINIGTTTALGRGDFDVLGAPNPTAHGVCWNTIPFSTLAQSLDYTDNGATASAGVFTSNIIGLTPDTLYYIRAYATNNVDTDYGDQRTFTTLPKAPVVTTQAVSDITKDDAIGHGTITDRGIPDLEEHGICWSRAPTIPTRSNNDGITTLGSYSGPVSYSFESTISPLVPFRNYNVRAYAANSAGTVYGATQPFRSDPDAMAVGTDDVTDIDQTSATGGGDITNLGEPAATQHGICWNTTGTDRGRPPTTGDSFTREGVPARTGTYTSEMTDLSPGTTYYVRAYVTNTLTTVYGGEVVFTTFIEPTVTTFAVNLISDTKATANGSITDLGEPSPDDHGFCWSTDPGPTLDDNDDCRSMGPYSHTVPYAFKYRMTDLLPETTYYVSAYATNAAGTDYGLDDSFVTEPPGSSGSSGSGDDSYSCFIGTTRSEAGQWIPTKWIGFLFLAVVSAFFLSRFMRQRLGALMLVMAILLGAFLFASNSYAAEGAAAGAPPQTESTETVPAVGVPTPLEEEKSKLERLRKLEKKQGEYTPVAVGSAETVSSLKKRKPWYLHTGLGFAYIGSEVKASSEGESITNEVDSAIYPFLRGSYEFSDNFSVELTFAYDFYSGNIKNSPSDDDSSLNSYTFSLSGVYYAKEYNPRWIGTMRPLVIAGIGYRYIDADLDFPVSGYDPAMGFSIGTGFQKGNVEVRLSYAFYKHDADGPEDGSADDQLDTSGIALEISYRFNIF